MNKIGNKPSLSIIIVNYNTCEMTEACIASVQAETSQQPFEIILVDNASTDGSVEHFRQKRGDITFIALDRNYGFAYANNVGATHANGDHLLLLNSDTVVLNGAIDKLMAFARTQPQAGIWGGRTVFADGSLNPTSCWGRMTVWSLFCMLTGLRAAFPNSAVFSSETYGGWQRDTPRQVDIVTGCFLLIRRDLWDQLGGFSETFFMYGEDADLCLRAAAQGARPMITPEATIIHHGGKSETVRTRKEIQLLRAKLTTIDYQYTGLKRWLCLSMLRALPLSRRIGYGLGARLRGRQRYAAKADVWREVWKRRGEWWHGYASGPGSEVDGGGGMMQGSASDPV